MRGLKSRERLEGSRQEESGERWCDKQKQARGRQAGGCYGVLCEAIKEGKKSSANTRRGWEDERSAF